MRNLQIIGEHTIDISLLNKGVAIDVGCLGFEFTKGLHALGCEVHAFDLIDMECPVVEAYFGVAAITDKDQKVRVLETPDRQGWHLNPKGSRELDSISVNKLYKFFEHAGMEVDVLKLDAEGSELDILSDPLFRPYPKQITVEWHMHCQKTKHERLYDKCMDNLLKYYVPVQHELSSQHGCGLNYWDSLFIRKDLI